MHFDGSLIHISYISQHKRWVLQSLANHFKLMHEFILNAQSLPASDLSGLISLVVLCYVWSLSAPHLDVSQP